uniref:Uncharacterized protein n=2 Tax=Corethron hystrix TaxID=216773 RepID=A0A7S1B9C3_9STRA
MYACKYKGMTSSDLYWEYWRDIKSNFVDLAEDFWLRQAYEPLFETNARRPRPHIKEFQKLTTSPSFAVSTKLRPGGPPVDPKTQTNFKLRGYQLEGVNWLLWNWWGNRSCILADEMGLGKTIQTVATLVQLDKMDATQVRGPFLMVAPLTLLQQWASEVAVWAPDFNTVVYHGSADARAYIVQQEFYWNAGSVGSKPQATRLKRQSVTKFNLLLTTYEVVLKDIHVLSKITWKALIVDEAHRLKNTQSRLFRELNSVPRDWCLLLTGTPLQNSTEELWALLNFANGDAFSSKETFCEKFGQLKQSQQVKDLHGMLKPFLLRRVKEDVEKSLPPKEETILEVTLTPTQKAYYKAIYEKNTNFLFKGSKKSNAPSLMNIMMELRKCCNHPFLIRGIEDRILEEAAVLAHKANPDQPTDPSAIFSEQLVKSSGKMVILDKLLPKLKQGGHKVLIFSQMVRCLDLLQEFLRVKRYKFERLDGSTGAGARAAAVARFNQPRHDRFVMLLSTRAGGLGLNLTSANTVIIFDSDWNPQNDLQAMARAHRIGQTRSVHVYRFLTKKTYEMHMFHQASLKLGLDRAVLAHQRQEEGETKKMSQVDQAKEIDQLLKKGAYDVFRDEDDSENNKFMETDIDEIMARSSRTVTYGGENKGQLSSGLGSFSKASFVSADNTEDIDLNDPDFWQKAIGLDAPPEGHDDETSLLLAGLENKRSRKQVQVFDPYADEHKAEKLRQEKKDIAARLEKEEKDKARSERKKRKAEEKRLRRQDRHSDGKISKSTLGGTLGSSKKHKHKLHDKKKDKKSRRVAHEEPVIDKVKQVWDSTLRQNIIQALLRFGFHRFCKIRIQTGLTAMPIQDLEVFCRALLLQLGLSCTVPLLTNFQNPAHPDDATTEALLRPFLHLPGGEWVGQALVCALRVRQEIVQGERFIRLPRTLMDMSFLQKLQSGTARRALLRLAFMSKFNAIMEGVLDEVLQGLGSEDLGKRGCPKDLSSLDVDLKFYYLTIEEVFHGFSRLSERHSYHVVNHPGRPEQSWASPAAWWDNDCDLGLLVGTFIHGFGNYAAMHADDHLPFANRIATFARQNPHHAKSYTRYQKAAASAESVFKHGKTTTGKSLVGKEDAERVPEITAIGDRPSHGLDLESLALALRQDVDDGMASVAAELKQTHTLSEDRTWLYQEENYFASSLPMPDARVLDHLLAWLVTSYEASIFDKEPSFSSRYIFCESDTLLSPGHQDRRILQDHVDNACPEAVIEYNQNFVLDKFKTQNQDSTYLFSRLELAPENSYINIGFDRKIGKSLDSSDYVSGTATVGLATAMDSSSLKRGPGVPSNLTRFGITSLLLANAETIKKVGAESSDKSKDLIWKDVKQRATFCTIILRHGGCVHGTSSEDATIVHSDVLEALHGSGNDISTVKSTSSKTAVPLFSAKNVLELMRHAGSEEEMTGAKVIKYLEDELLPHCVRLCLQGVRGKWSSKTELPHNLKNDDLGKIVSIHDHELRTQLSPLPDPWLPLSHHGDGAITRALVLLRRVRLLKCVRWITGGNVPRAKLVAFLRGTFMRRSVIELPVWWCPWVHDLALLVGTASFGLLSLKKMRTPGLGIAQITKPAIEKFIREVFVEGKKLPRHILKCSDAVETWVEEEKHKFPSAMTVERRISMMCSKLSEKYAHKIDGDSCYNELPFFDQGAWPAKT